MCTIFGIRRSPGQRADEAFLRGQATRTARYALDGTYLNVFEEVGMGCQPYYTTQRSRLGSQPLADAIGNRIVFDGRLDNYQGLQADLDIRDANISDSVIVLSAFSRWGVGCFARFVGDWSVALWSREKRTLYLARDHAGTRTLYYRYEKGQLTWSTYLETLLAPDDSPATDPEYATRYLAGLPIGTTTPYTSIIAVPPAHYLACRMDTIEKTAYWSPLAKSKIRYRNDTEYDEHFLSLLRASVERRTVPGAPILAQLSGGVDSSAIVCISDQMRSTADSTTLLDTLSYYDDSEPHWDEQAYFSITEMYRGKRGIHVDSSAFRWTFDLPDTAASTDCFPGFTRGVLDREELLEKQIGPTGYRVILSGIGGDELLGGVPTPLPELADYLADCNLPSLLSEALAWSLSNRSSMLLMLRDTVRYKRSLYRPRTADQGAIPPWIRPRMRNLCADLLRQEDIECLRHDLSPSSISMGRGWYSILESQPHLKPGFTARREYRYPYLDRDLVDFLLRVPRAQMVQPGRRRAMMRRALTNLVPTQILERPRKAFLARNPLALFRNERSRVESVLRSFSNESCHYTDVAVLSAAFCSALKGAETRWNHLIKNAIDFELWLRRNGSQSQAINAA
jgi:asparagine synthase (glutamine-hydrolysing)